jgi:hypothetical protein
MTDKEIYEGCTAVAAQGIYTFSVEALVQAYKDDIGFVRERVEEWYVSRLPSSPQPTCVCEHAESQHWPESKDQYKLRRCSELGCDCERYKASSPQQGEPARADQIDAQPGTIRRLDSRFYCTINGKLYVRWEYAGGPEQCKHGYARCFVCPYCEALPQQPPPDDEIAELKRALHQARSEWQEEKKRALESEAEIARLKQQNEDLFVIREKLNEDVFSEERRVAAAEAELADTRKALLDVMPHLNELPKATYMRLARLCHDALKAAKESR